MYAEIASKEKNVTDECHKHEYGQQYERTEIETIPSWLSHSDVKVKKQVWIRRCKICGEEIKLHKSVYNRYMAC